MPPKFRIYTPPKESVLIKYPLPRPLKSELMTDPWEFEAACILSDASRSDLVRGKNFLMKSSF